MKKLFSITLFVSGLSIGGTLAAQGMLLDYAADGVIKKFQTSSCDQLKAQKGTPPSEKQKTAVAS